MGGNDVLRGADGIPIGHDTLDGGPGSDTADLSNFTISPFFHVLQLNGDNPVNVPGAFIGAGITEGTQTLISIENLWGSVRAENFVGDDRDNTFRGGGGADTLDGGAAVNTADYSDKTAPVNVTLNGSTQVNVAVNGVAEDKIKDFQNVIGGSNSDLLTGDGNDNTLDGNGGADTLKGGAGRDTLSGGEGNDVLMGGADDDTLDGGDGTDTADYGDKTLAVMVALQTAQQRADGTPVDVYVGGVAEDSLINIENVYGGSNDDVLIGNDLVNVLHGNTGDDTLRGGGGVDILVGGIGSDTADYGDQSGSVVVRLATDLDPQRTDHPGLPTVVQINGVADDRLYTIENITGGNGADHLVGNNLANTLLGNGNNDIIQGGGGSDTLDGGGGTDTVDYSEKTLSVQVTLNGATPSTVTVGGHDEDHISNFENIIGGSAGDLLTGDGGANTIDGRGGIDTMAGLGGNDTYLVDNAKDVVTEAVGGGSDTVSTSVSYSLGAGQEIEFLNSSLHIGSTLAGPTLTGNEFAQTITGDGGADIIDGKGGADTMIGLGGNDTYYVDDPNDVVNEAIGGGALDRVFTSFSYTLGNGQEIETLSTVDHAATSSINLNGNSFVNTIQGNAGDNVIDGRFGNDTLTGFGGHDSFDFTTGLDPVNNIATITDFTVGNDKIGLSHVVFATLSGQLQAAQFSTGAAAQGPDDRIIYNADTGALIYDSNGNGEGSATQFATLSPHLALSNTDFFIV
jgi:Ca2+-binding RTX toxin-like protein